jgi:hypothetical protein
MNYFSQLLSVLTQEEIERLESLAMTPTERRIFEFLRSQPPSKIDPVEIASATLELTHNTFYKNCSLLLRKAYQAFAPDGGLSLLNFLLKKKSLVQNGLRELERQEESLVPTLSNEQCERYYACVFHLLRSTERIEIPMPYFVDYGKKYVASRCVPSVDDERAVQIYLEQRTFSKALRQTSKRFSPEFAQDYKRSLDEHHDYVLKSNHPFSLFNLHSAYFSFYYQTRTDFEHLRSHLDGILEWLPREIDEQFPWVRVTRELDYGMIDMLLGEYQNAYDFYDTHYSSRTEYTSVRTQMDFFIAALWTGNLERAKSIIEETRAPRIDQLSGPSRTSVLSEMWLALLHLLGQQYELAHSHLTNAAQWNRAEIYSPYNESIIRTLEICLAFLKKDWDFTEQLITRNRQWLRRNEFSGADATEVPFTDIVKAYLDRINYGRSIPDVIDQLRSEMFRTEVAGVFGKLLDRMRELAQQSVLVRS